MGVLDQDVLLQANHHLCLAGGDTRQPFSRQRAADFSQHRHRDQRGMNQGFRQRNVAAFLSQQHEVHLVHAQPAVFFRHGHAHHTQFCQLRPQRILPTAVGFPGPADAFRGYLIDQKIPYGLLEQKLIFAKGEIHRQFSLYVPSGKAQRACHLRSRKHSAQGGSV